MALWKHFWAKTDRDGTLNMPSEWTHPLWAHMLDVANVAELLWERFVPEPCKTRIAVSLGQDEAVAGHFLSGIIGLHDIGKATPAFQTRHRHSKDRLQDAGLDFGESDSIRKPHGHASIPIIEEILRDAGYSDSGLVDFLGAFVGIHHGSICMWKDWSEWHASSRSPLGSEVWRKNQLALAKAVLDCWGVKWPTVDSAELEPWQLAFAGWTTLADWIGSMQSEFPIDAASYTTLRDYNPASRKAAENALRRAGFGRPAALQTHNFESMFGRQPRPLQEATASLALDSDVPGLTIIEAPTGEGKTEAAFHLATRQQAAYRPGGGLYVAMPTQATTNGLYLRLREFLAPQIPELLSAHDPERGGDVANLRLVHSNDMLDLDTESLRFADSSLVTPDDKERSPSAVRAETLEWFLPRKRALLAPYGVGTVDQTFLSVLYTRHFFLRVFALAGKTVIFDEVHAYDTYMNTLFMTLLKWLKAVGSHIIILSATLPAKTRVQFFDAWGVPDGQSASPGDKAPYPVLWHVSDKMPKLTRFESGQSQKTSVKLDWHPTSEKAIAATALEHFDRGACVGIIVNTVKRAQRIRRKLEKLRPANGDFYILHARYPQGMRSEKERNVLARFGRDRSDLPAILVATQIVEQSLDLDFDVLISDLAPIDLLLQRIGRLHRHMRQRPPGYEVPTLFLCCEDGGDRLPDVHHISGRGHVYDHVTLWRTWRVLRDIEDPTLPIEYRNLIEAVYGDVSDLDSRLSQIDPEAWMNADRRQQDEQKELQRSARLRCVVPPQDLLSLFTYQEVEVVEDDSPGLHQHLRAATRDPSAVSQEALCLHECGGTLYFEPTHDAAASLDVDSPRKLRTEELRALLRTSVRLSHRGVIVELQKTPPWWAGVVEKNPFLRRYVPLVFENGHWMHGKLQLRFSETCGIIVGALEHGNEDGNRA